MCIKIQVNKMMSLRYAFFIPIDQIDSNYKENTHRNPGGVNGTLKIKSQVGAWQLEGNFMLNVRRAYVVDR